MSTAQRHRRHRRNADPTDGVLTGLVVVGVTLTIAFMMAVISR